MVTLRERREGQEHGKPPQWKPNPRPKRRRRQNAQPEPAPDPEPEREPEIPEQGVANIPAPIVERAPARPPPPRTPSPRAQTPRRGSGPKSPYLPGSVGITPNEARLQRMTPRNSPSNRAEEPRTPGGSNRGSERSTPSPRGRPSPGREPHTPERPQDRPRGASVSPSVLLNTLVGPLIGQRPQFDEEVDEEDEEEVDEDDSAEHDPEDDLDAADDSDYEDEEDVLLPVLRPWHNWRRNLAILFFWLLTVFLAGYYIYPGCRWWRSNRYSFRETVWPPSADMRFLRGRQWRGPPGSYEAMRFHPVLQ